MTAYSGSAYAESLAEFGTPRFLTESEGWILERPTPYFPYKDGMGCYPFFSCANWSGLDADIDDLSDDLVCITMVPDPFGDYDETYLRECFSDLVIPFKQHFIVDMNNPISDTVSRHHQKYARKAGELIQTDVCSAPAEFIEQWISLHQNLVVKHEIKGIRAFSRQAFVGQLNIPGMVVLHAKYQDEIVGAQLWFVQNNVAYGHVLAFNDLGYQLGASYALYWFALNYFSDKVRWCDLGGVAGIHEDGGDGLSLFKTGWSTGKNLGCFCGRILNPDRYEALVTARNLPANNYFPAYRLVF